MIEKPKKYIIILQKLLLITQSVQHTKSSILKMNVWCIFVIL